ncbi:glycine-rich domain-containing protein [Marinomonas algicola]|uniref:glycine-rich domain-containing protein n=1 Tax=Marinomonas algicola TaxID=2773454 RepID=UPI0019D60260|nr:hypothetical protein [Marinomonas algicola]
MKTLISATSAIQNQFDQQSYTLASDLNETDGVNKSVHAIDFQKLKWKLTKSAEATWSDDMCDFAELEYKKFLTLKLLYPRVSLVPSKIVDKFWHEHILDTKSYAEDCMTLFGSFLHHYPYFGIYGDDDQKALQVAFDETIAVYESHFGSYPTDVLFSQQNVEAARCSDHACHAPSTCACRVPGACK